MKTILGILVLLAAGVSAIGQGTVNLNNNFVPTGGITKAFIAVNRIPMAKALGSVDILDSTGAVIKSGSLATDGIFAFGVLEIPNAPIGGAGSITIRAWDNSTGSSFETAFVKDSVVVTLTGLGGGATPPPSLGAASNFVGINFIPEPSTYALAVVGLVGLCFVARRR
ncbi:MAG: hypothetical protein RIS76_1664 [Verrucomicrobiota bacterium]|jgi:hypothetical protein